MRAISISRQDVLWRSEHGWPKNGVRYNQGATYSDGSGEFIDGYRADCSGFVSMCGAMPTSGSGSWGGYSTTTFLSEEAIYEITWGEVKPGDMLGKCGPNTAGNNGHIGLVIKKNSDGTYLVRDHGGSGDALGYDERNVSWGASGTLYRPFRFMGIDGFMPDLGYRQLATGAYGFDVRLLQEGLNVVMKSGLKADRDFGVMTLQAVKGFQQIAFPQTPAEWDGVAGPKTISALKARLTPPAPPVPPVPPVPVPTTPDLAAVLARLEKLEASALTLDGAKVLVAEDIREAIAEIRLVLPADK